MNAWLIVAIVLVAAVLGLLTYMGVFHTPQFSKENVGPFVLAYREHRGRYRDMGPTFHSVCSIVGQKKIPDVLPACMAFDDPRVAGEANCRAFCGMLIPPSAVNASLTSWLAEQNVSLKQIPASMAYVTWFVYRNVYSYMIGPRKVYPAARKLDNTHMGTNDHGSLEVYGKTHTGFYFPIDNVDAWSHSGRSSTRNR